LLNLKQEHVKSPMASLMSIRQRSGLANEEPLNIVKTTPSKAETNIVKTPRKSSTLLHSKISAKSKVDSVAGSTAKRITASKGIRESEGPSNHFGKYLTNIDFQDDKAKLTTSEFYSPTSMENILDQSSKDPFSDEKEQKPEYKKKYATPITESKLDSHFSPAANTDAFRSPRKSSYKMNTLSFTLNEIKKRSQSPVVNLVNDNLKVKSVQAGDTSVSNTEERIRCHKHNSEIPFCLYSCSKKDQVEFLAYEPKTQVMYYTGPLEAGLMALDVPQSRPIWRYDLKKNSKPDSVMTGLLSVDEQDLWVSTSACLFVLDPVTLKKKHEITALSQCSPKPEFNGLRLCPDTCTVLWWISSKKLALVSFERDLQTVQLQGLLSYPGTHDITETNSLLITPFPTGPRKLHVFPPSSNAEQFAFMICSIANRSKGLCSSSQAVLKMGSQKQE
jgi:hypothetical protein